mgnify:FL=1
MNLNSLFEKQKELDEYIAKEKGLDKKHTLEKITALSIELGELMNEFPELFKFWSNKKNNREKGLVEYVDAVHFALSIGIDMGYTEHKYTKTIPKDMRMTYLGLQNILAILAVTMDKRHLPTLFDYLITFGYQLGFTEQDVIKAYDEKNEINYARQNSGY